jgi:hypothetical protein
MEKLHEEEHELYHALRATTGHESIMNCHTRNKARAQR